MPGALHWGYGLVITPPFRHSLHARCSTLGVWISNHDATAMTPCMSQSVSQRYKDTPTLNPTVTQPSLSLGKHSAKNRINGKKPPKDKYLCKKRPT
jgi:hypothetical protein